MSTIVNLLPAYFQEHKLTFGGYVFSLVIGMAGKPLNDFGLEQLSYISVGLSVVLTTLLIIKTSYDLYNRFKRKHDDSK